MSSLRGGAGGDDSTLAIHDARQGGLEDRLYCNAAQSWGDMAMLHTILDK
jgi:diphthamide synthase (EF-2-diphthine--ammonia ligase)